jgi:catechol 2,3-dioxygenase-like lactoylglutathione lyase family enzyme
MKEKKFHRVSPHLPVTNLQQTLHYYRDTLGFHDEWKEGEKDGGISRDYLRLLFAEDPTFTAVINNDQHRLPLMWFVDRIEDIYAEFQARNIEIATPLALHPYGLKEFAFIDINGYYIRVAEAAS